jgi:hypothetical protein
MLHRKQVSNGRPVSRRVVHWARQQLKRNVRSFRPGNITELTQRRGDFRFLKLREAKGCTMSQHLIMLCAHPSISTLCEEMLHAIQHHKGMRNKAIDRYGNDADLIMELLAAQTLVANERRWRIPAYERTENRRRMRTFAATLKRHLRGMPWPLRSKLSRSQNFLTTSLESWMGKYLTER